jgi:hypothetical protein
MNDKLQNQVRDLIKEALKDVFEIGKNVMSMGATVEKIAAQAQEKILELYKEDGFLP